MEFCLPLPSIQFQRASIDQSLFTMLSSTRSPNPVIFSFGREYGKKLPRLSCQDFLQSRLEVSKNLYRKDLYSHFGCVNAIEFSSDGQCLVSGGDDRRVLLWDVEKATSTGTHGSPLSMKGEHSSNIFCLGFDSQNKRLFSAGNDEQVG